MGMRQKRTLGVKEGEPKLSDGRNAGLGLSPSVHVPIFKRYVSRLGCDLYYYLLGVSPGNSGDRLKFARHPAGYSTAADRTHELTDT